MYRHLWWCGVLYPAIALTFHDFVMDYLSGYVERDVAESAFLEAVGSSGLPPEGLGAFLKKAGQPPQSKEDLDQTFKQISGDSTGVSFSDLVHEMLVERKWADAEPLQELQDLPCASLWNIGQIRQVLASDSRGFAKDDVLNLFHARKSHGQTFENFFEQWVQFERQIQGICQVAPCKATSFTKKTTRTTGALAKTAITTSTVKMAKRKVPLGRRTAGKTTTITAPDPRLSDHLTHRPPPQDWKEPCNSGSLCCVEWKKADTTAVLEQIRKKQEEAERETSNRDDDGCTQQDYNDSDNTDC